MSIRFFECFQFGILLTLLLLGATRALWLRARGVPVFVIDRQRTTPQMLADAMMLVCLLLWAYEIVAHALPLGFHARPEFLAQPLLNSLPLRLLGMVVNLAGLFLYTVSVLGLGVSWRLGLDRALPGPLVTGGIYARLRHPIYVAFDLLFLGTFLALQQTIFLLLLLSMVPLLHSMMLREEHFLTHQYGNAYRDYCGRVGRYF